MNLPSTSFQHGSLNLQELMTLFSFFSLQSVMSHPYFTSLQSSITTFPGPLTTFENLKYPGNYLAINSDAKLTTIVNNYGPDGLAQHSTDQPDEPNPWFRMNYTGQHRLRDRLCDARVDSDAICVGSQALVGDTEKESASDEEEVLWRIELNTKQSKELVNSWSVFIVLPTRGLICLEFTNDISKESVSLRPYFMEIDLDADSVDKKCIFVATNY